MQTFFTPRNLLAFAILGLVFLIAACRSNTPTTTPPPPTVNVPTALPPAPTAPPLTEAPTVPIPTEAPPPAATAVIPTNTPETNPTQPPPTSAPANPTASSGGTTTNPTRAASNPPAAPTVDRGPLTGLYVAGLRVDPATPRTGDAATFFVTVINQTGREQYYPVCVEIFRPNAQKSFGITDCSNLTIVPGTGEVMAGRWIGSGIKECIPVRARAVLREEGEGEVRWVFTTTNGGELWTDFNVCP